MRTPRGPRPARIARSVLEVTVAVYVVMFLYGLVRADALVFFPPEPSYGADAIDTMLTTASGDQIAVRHLRVPDATHTVLYSHGNAEDLGDLEPTFEEFAAQGFSVAGYDYSGYGLSTGKPSERAARENIDAVYEYLLAEGVAPERIVVFGRSVGAAPSIHLAREKPVGGLILEGAFISAFRVRTQVRLFPVERFDNLGGLRRVSVPVLVIHGTDDEVIPIRHGRALYDAASSPKSRLWVEGARHDDVPWVGGERYWRAVGEFAASTEGAR